MLGQGKGLSRADGDLTAAEAGIIENDRVATRRLASPGVESRRQPVGRKAGTEGLVNPEPDRVAEGQGLPSNRLALPLGLPRLAV